MIKLVKVKQSFYELCKEHGVANELLFNQGGRPCVLLVRLKYKGELRDFVVPLRSNISPATPKAHYFPLPPNPKTKPKHRHGVHYVKLFPADRRYIDVYAVSESDYYQVILKILINNERVIVRACQSYLTEYENGYRHFSTPDIDGIMSIL